MLQAARSLGLVDSLLHVGCMAAPAMSRPDKATVGIIGMGDMGKMYTRRLSEAGWK